MNKVVLTGLAMSAVLVLSGCSSSSRHSQGGHSSYKSCPTCGSGSYSVQHGHRGQRSGGGNTFVKVAGAVVVGGLLYSALDDGDDNDSGSHTK